MAEGPYRDGGVWRRVDVEEVSRPGNSEPPVWWDAISSPCDRSCDRPELSAHATTARSAVVAAPAPPPANLPPPQSPREGRALRSLSGGLPSTGAHFEAVVQVAGQDIAMHEVLVQELCHSVDEPVQHSRSQQQWQQEQQQQQQQPSEWCSVVSRHSDSADFCYEGHAEEEQRREQNRALQAHFLEWQIYEATVAELQRAKRELEKLAAQYAQHTQRD